MTSLHLPSHPIHPTPLIPCSDIPPPSFSPYSSYSSYPMFIHPSTFLLILFILLHSSRVQTSLHIPSHPIHPTLLIPPHSFSSYSSYSTHPVFRHPSTFLLIQFILLYSSIHIPSHPIHPTLLIPCSFIPPHSFSSFILVCSSLHPSSHPSMSHQIF